MAYNVKFLKGTAAQYTGLATKDVNTFYYIDGKDLYSTIEEKASNFLYLIIKNHIFIDGNKRITATLFIYFLN